MTSILSIRDLHAGYEGSHVLNGVDLEVEKGQVTALLGRNGVGKSTLIMAIMGIVRVSRGTIQFDGRNVAGQRSDRVAKAGIGLVPQGRRVFTPLTVEENLRIAARSIGDGGWTVESVFDFLPRLAERRRNRGDQLSGGEQQMLAIGRALVGNPRLMLLDEPSEGLAPSILKQIGDVLGELRRNGVSMVLVEQDLSTALRVADSVAAMVKGQIVLHVSTVEFEANPQLAADILGVA